MRVVGEGREGEGVEAPRAQVCRATSGAATHCTQSSAAGYKGVGLQRAQMWDFPAATQRAVRTE